MLVCQIMPQITYIILMCHICEKVPWPVRTSRQKIHQVISQHTCQITCQMSAHTSDDTSRQGSRLSFAADERVFCGSEFWIILKSLGPVHLIWSTTQNQTLVKCVGSTVQTSESYGLSHRHRILRGQTSHTNHASGVAVSIMIYDRGTMIFRPDVYLSQVFSSCIWNLLVRYRKIGKWSEIARHSPQKLFPERILGYVWIC